MARSSSCRAAMTISSFSGGLRPSQAGTGHMSCLMSPVTSTLSSRCWEVSLSCTLLRLHCLHVLTCQFVQWGFPNVNVCFGMAQSRVSAECLSGMSNTRACLQQVGWLCRDYLSDFQIDQFFQVPASLLPRTHCDACPALLAPLMPRRVQTMHARAGSSLPDKTYDSR